MLASVVHDVPPWSWNVPRRYRTHAPPALAWGFSLGPRRTGVTRNGGTLPTTLYGRDRETAEVARLLEAAAAGRGGGLLVLGEPGAGKSALLGHAREAGALPRVVEVRAPEPGDDRPFGGLRRLLAEHPEPLAVLPGPQALALEAVASGEAAAPFAVYTGLLGILSGLGGEGGVLVLADDLERVDPMTRAALAFAARRLDGLPAALLVSAATSDGAWSPGVPELRLAGIDAAAARRLLGPDVSRSVAARLVEATGGNPRALLEVAAALPPEQLSGAAPLDDPPPPAITVVHAHAGRLAMLGDRARLALTVVAATECGGLPEVAGALEALGLDLSALDEAEAAGLVDLGPRRVAFRHPGLRSAAYHLAPAADRAAARRALRATGGWLAGGSSGNEADRLRRAASSAPDRAQRVRLGLAAGRAALADGDPEGALAWVDGMLAADGADDLRAPALVLRGRALLARGPLDEAVGDLLRGAALLAAADPEAAAAARVTAAEGELLGGDPAGAAVAAVAALDVGAVGGDAAARAGRVLRAVAHLRGDVPPAGPGASTGGPAATVWDGEGDGAGALTARAESLLRDGRLDEARVVAAEARSSAEALGDRPARALAAGVLAGAAARSGDEESCRRWAVEARDVAGRARMGAWRAVPEAVLGSLDLSLGDAPAAAEHLRTAQRILDGAGVAHPDVVPCGPDLVEALDACGLAEEARGEAAALADRASRAGSDWGRAAAEHALGVVAAPPAAEGHLARAAALHTAAGRSEAAARARLALGLRLAGLEERRAQARELLESARAAFAAAGARAWEARAAEALASAGGRSAATAAARLTSQELQVARLVGDGATNKEVASALYLSPKTVEFHLSNAYRKLGIRSRSELARLVAEGRLSH